MIFLSFTIQDIKDQADSLLSESWVGETIDGYNAIRWANECLRFKIGSNAWTEDNEEYTATTNKWYSLPSDFIRTVGVSITIGIPTGLTVTPTGTPGLKTYGYRIAAVNASGETLACAEVATTTGNTTLSDDNYNALEWDEVTGATSYNVYRTTSGGTPATTGLIGSPTTNSIDDTGLDGDSDIVPSEDTSGDEYTDFSIRNRKIKFSAADTYILTYVAHPAALTGINDTVPMQDIFMHPMAKFLLSKHLYTDSERRKEAELAMAEFQVELKDVLDELELDNDPFQVEEVW